jgi:hypothetical protein
MRASRDVVAAGQKRRAKKMRAHPKQIGPSVKMANTLPEDDAKVCKQRERHWQ